MANTNVMSKPASEHNEREDDIAGKVPTKRAAGEPHGDLGLPVLADLIDELLAEASDPDLFAARDCSRNRAPLKELGKIRRMSGEAVRQRVAKDIERIRDALAKEQFKGVRQGAGWLIADFGLVIPADHDVVEQWKTGLGERRFEVLRWVAGYVYRENRLQRGADAWAKLLKIVNDVIGDEWLIKEQNVLDHIDGLVISDVAQSMLTGSGGWRDIGGGWLVKWDGDIWDKAERVLRLACRPMTPAELAEAIGHGSSRTIRNVRGTNLMRLDKAFRLVPRDWGMHEYKGIVAEITQRIELGGGIASKAAILDEVANQFSVKVSSVRANLALPIFNITGDSVRLADSFKFDPMPPSTVEGAVQTANGWAEVLTVTKDHMRGCSFSISPHIAWENGLRPSDNLLVAVNGSSEREASIIWNLTRLDGRVGIGQLRTWLEKHEVVLGNSVLLCPTPTGVHIRTRACDV